MTTERATPMAGHRTTVVGSAVRGALVATSAAGLATVLVAALTSGSAAASGAAVATVVVCLFFGLGALVIGTVARRAPAASLLVALLTYTLKVFLIGLLFVVLNGSGALDGTLDPQWLGGTVIGCTLVWLAAQIVVSARARQPLYDLPSEGEQASVR